MLRVALLVCAIAVASSISVSHGSRRLQPNPIRTRSTEVTSLPGYKHPLPSRHFAGYIGVGGEDSSRKLYFYLVAAEQQQQQQQRDASPFAGSDDLLIWLTGGPGCSSMDAWTYEHGPFSFSFKPGSDVDGRSPTLSDVELSPNPSAWSKAANVLYIDSPAGTGFSYSPAAAGSSSSDAGDDGDDKPYHSDDSATIDDLEEFVGLFLERYPELAQHRLVLAGESYGGVYIPLLAQRLLRHNQRLAAATEAEAASSLQQPHHPQQQQQPPGRHYNVAGYMVGNAVTDDEFDGNGQVAFAYGAGLVDPLTHARVLHTCERNFWNASEHSPCSNALEDMEAVMGDINQYDVLSACFFHPDNARRTLRQQQQQQQQLRASGGRQQPQPRSTWPLSGTFPRPDTPITNMYSLQKAAAASAASGSAGSAMLGHTISCADRRHALLYFNDAAVRRAIHADSLEEASRWEPCSDVLSYRHTAGSMIPVHQELIAAGVRGLVLSGDADYVVPFTGSRDWVFSLALPQVRPWHPWKLPGDQQVAGYAVEFEGLTFATVKGAGHMVPQTKPPAALALLQLWLQRRL